jgi:hypothetical protein
MTLFQGSSSSSAFESSIECFFLIFIFNYSSGREFSSSKLVLSSSGVVVSDAGVSVIDGVSGVVASLELIL